MSGKKVMQQLVVIQVRTARKNIYLLKEFLADWLAQITSNGKGKSIEIYKHVSVETDYSIYLRYDTMRAGENYQVIGERLSSALKDFGLVNFNVWNELEL